MKKHNNDNIWTCFHFDLCVFVEGDVAVYRYLGNLYCLPSG